MHPKIISISYKKQICIYPKLKIEDDNPRQFDRVSVDLQMSKMPISIGPELQCLQVSYLFHFNRSIDIGTRIQ